MNPDVGVLAVGSEILSGKTVDTNTGKMIDLLFSRGLRVRRWVIVPDDREAISSEVRTFAEAGCGLLIVSGGMGPTHDDITVEAVAKGVGRKMVRSSRCYSVMEKKYRSRIEGGELDPKSTASMEKMCRLPEGFSTIPNNAGMAEGLYGSLSDRGGTLIMLPGVPKEYEAVMNHPVFLGLIPVGEKYSFEEIRFHGKESQLSQLLERFQREHPSMEIGSYPQDKSDVIVRLTGKEDEVKRVGHEIENGLKDILARPYLEPSGNSEGKHIKQVE